MDSLSHTAQRSLIPPSYKPSRPHLRGDWEPDWAYIRWCVLGTTTFYALAATFVHSASMFDDWNTESELFQSIYFRDSVNTTWFPSSQFWTYIGLAMLGWAFINTINCQRSDPFTSGNGDHKSFHKLLWLSPIIFLDSVIVIQRGTHDLEGWCPAQNVTEAIFDAQPEPAHSGVHYLGAGNNVGSPVFLDDAEADYEIIKADVIVTPPTSATISAEVDDPTLLLFSTIDIMGYLKGIFHVDEFTPECHIYTNEEVFKWNYYVWCFVFFFVGLQFTHFDVGPLQDFTLTKESIATWGRGLWIFAICLLALILLILKQAFSHYRALGILSYFIAWGGFIVAVISWNTKRLEGIRELHIHHYCIGFILMSFLSYQSLILTIAHAFFNGMFIEGGCRWGFDAIWTPVN